MANPWVRPVAGLLTAMLVSGCWSNSMPSAQGFIRPAPVDCPNTPDRLDICNKPQVVHVFADANGTLYPSQWGDRIDKDDIARRHSLYNAARDGDREWIDEREQRLLDDIGTLQAAGGRLFILIHGFNNKVSEADEAYRKIEPQLGLKSEDRVIRFYWDGLDGHNMFGDGRVWFYATGNSQMVGSRALRNILRRFEDRDIYLIGHSRGTSVILSALANPVYNPVFLQRTKDLAAGWDLNDPDEFVHPKPLEDRGNRIHVVAAAAAVDRIDFCSADAQKLADAGRFHCPAEYLKPLGPQVKTFRYTVNSSDPVLNKFVGLSRRFNPTGLGLRAEVGEALARHYPVLQPCHMQPFPVHRFAVYAEKPEFRKLLAAALAHGDLADRPCAVAPEVQP